MRPIAPCLLGTLSLLACSVGGRDDSLGDELGSASSADESGATTASDEGEATGASESDSGSDDATTGESPDDGCGGCPDSQLCIPDQGCTDCTRESCPELILYAAPEGSGDACSYAMPCRLHVAQQRVRAATPTQSGDLRVYLRGGTYWLGEVGPLELDPSLDSGQGGFVVEYRAYPGERPSLSGARALGAWTLIDPQLGIWRAASQAPGSRHLIVGGVPARRARGPEAPAGFVETATGYLAPDLALANLQDPQALELVGLREWKSFRCPVSAIVGSAITIAPTCWANAQWHQGQGYDFTLALPQWFENAIELLDEPGEFVRSSDGAQVDYIPRPGQDLARVDAREPVLTQLITSLGQPGSPIHDLRFVGLEFADTTWALGPDGFSELQAGIYHVGAQVQAKMPAALEFGTAERIVVEQATLTRLAAAGVALGPGSKSNQIVGSRFDTLGGVAIQLADVRESWHHHAEDPSQITLDNAILDNFITRAGLDFPGSPGIWVGYAEQTEVARNELFDLPYTGISVGWGWGGVDVGGGAGYLTPANSRANHIHHNRVEYYMRVLRDGGGIYVLGDQPESQMNDNYLANQGDPYGALYLDNGTQHYVVSRNVVEKVPYWLLCQTWSTNATNNQVIDNFTELDNPFTLNPNPSNVVANNVVFGSSLPPLGQAIVAASGLSDAYAGLHGEEVARGKPASASSNWTIDYAAALAFDGEGKTGWSALGPDQDPDPWLQVDLGAPLGLGRVELVTRWDIDQPDTRTSLELLAADEPSFADPIVLARSGPQPLSHRAIWAVEVDPSVPHRYLRIRREAGGYLFVAELRVLAAAP